MASKSENDLPLVSNIKDILVTHYMLEFSCHIEERIFNCSAVLFLEPVCINETKECNCVHYNLKSTKDTSTIDIHTENPSKENFMFILDCHKLLISNVEEIKLAEDEKDCIKYAGLSPLKFSADEQLKFSADIWSLKIWKDSSFCKFCFPKCIRVSYKTIPEGPSLLWVTDQDKNPAVFTYGAWINNRSLFPCQEPPSAMATWEATVSVEDPAIVLMSGDEDARIRSEEGRKYFYYFTKSVLPMSTLCLAVGQWTEFVISTKNRSSPKCRIFATSSLIDESIQELFEYVPYCLLISEDILGSYPFPRIDLLVVPPTFGSLGMASPNIVFLSQSLLTRDSSMCSRVAHEIGHGWFGLLIGASDWTEEWLSEGFATFVEDYFHVRTMNMSEQNSRDYIEVKTYIRLRTLLQEVSNTNEDLQVLRPSRGETTTETVDGVNAAILKNGQNPVKAFIQVHYIKGYFLLKHLASVVGIGSFFAFLKGYIEKYRGQLVTSKDFLTEFFTWFPNVRSQLTMEQIYEEWLHNPGIPLIIKNMKPSMENALYSKAMEEAQKWKRLNISYLKQKRKRRKFDSESYCQLTSEQLILLLEDLLEELTLNSHTLKQLADYFNLPFTNAEVQHRWFELVVKFKYKPSYGGLGKFLINHLAMGVYLFGEMIFSNDSCLRSMAEEHFLMLKLELEPNYVSTIEQMLLDAKE